MASPLSPPTAYVEGWKFYWKLSGPSGGWACRRKLDHWGYALEEHTELRPPSFLFPVSCSLDAMTESSAYHNLSPPQGHGRKL